MSDDLNNVSPGNAVSLYGQDDAMDDFPVLKAFQQYIDAEQAKARKRMMILCAFFGMLMMIVVSVFVVLLVNVSQRNQSLNDKMLDYVMKDHERRTSGSAVVVQPSQDSSAIIALTTKLEEMQKKLSDSQAQAATAAQAAAKAAEDTRPKPPSAEQLEIQQLKALLNAEKEKAKIDKERQHREEIERYRRKHYPELYVDEMEPSGEDDEEIVLPRRRKNPRPTKKAKKGAILDKDIDTLLDDLKPIGYFEEETEKNIPSASKVQPAPTQRKASQVPSQAVPKPVAPPPATVAPETAPQAPSPSVQVLSRIPHTPSQERKSIEKNSSIPVEIKGSSSLWNIPME